MKTIDIETTVGEMVRAAPARSRIFENLGIDYCCGGKKPLAEACRAKGLDPAKLTDTYTPPDWACNTFRALYDGLAQLESNMHQHVHKENNVLFPRALAFGGSA
jgi:iron-sulfur cluster repair protein YtfE (RIC family)